MIRRSETFFLLVLACVSLSLHLFLLPRLYIVEDESAYMQDAAQIGMNFLPFREFGGTKGPLWLFLFHGWQLLFGHSIIASRLFSSLAHVASIFLFWHLVRSFQVSKRVVYGAVLLWGLSAVAVSLTTNVTHIPLEILCVVASFLCLRQTRPSYAIPAAMLLWAAFLMRATAVAFIPVVCMLIVMRPDRWNVLWRFCITGFFALFITILAVYPSYGWPKTAFFFNADATLIANKQRAVYASATQTSPIQELYDAALPLRRDGLSIIIPALFLPLILAWRIWRREKLQTMIIAFLLVWVGSFILFYKGWGRSPTPFYPLEVIPALSFAAAISIDTVISLGKKKHLETVLFAMVLALFITDVVIAYRDIPLYQYRGTVEVRAAEEVAVILQQHVPISQPIFTGQPIYAYLAGRSLYGGYTHPGWYLSERAGYLPSEIRRVFYPDFDILASMVEKDVFWIVADWRTNDIFFNSNTPETRHFRSILAQHFESIATVSNPASRDIVIYKRK